MPLVGSGVSVCWVDATYRPLRPVWFPGTCSITSVVVSVVMSVRSGALDPHPVMSDVLMARDSLVFSGSQVAPRSPYRQAGPLASGRPCGRIGTMQHG